MRQRIILFSGIYVIWLLVVSFFWYSEFIHFHWFDDVYEWQFMDKLGHFFTSFYMGCLCVDIIGNEDSSQLIKKNTNLSFAGFFLLLPVEMLDGLSPNYGASIADIAANGAGSVYCFFYLTTTRIHSVTPKFSFHYTLFSIIRPNLLGNGILQPIIKDYNGQTYWYSFNINQLLGIKILPEWFLIAFGVGANGLLGGHDNVWTSNNGATMDYSAMPRTTRIFLSIDVDVTYFTKKHPRWHKGLFIFRLIKTPAPAIEFSLEQGILIHPIYF